MKVFFYSNLFTPGGHHEWNMSVLRFFSLHMFITVSKITKINLASYNILFFALNQKGILFFLCLYNI